MTLARLAVLVPAALLLPAHAAVVHDESVDGDLSSNAAAPTSLAFSLGSNVVSGTTFSANQPGGDRDFLTFTLGAGQQLASLRLLAYSPDDPGFIAFNAGPTGFVPDASTDANFLAGILISDLEVGADLLPLFVSSAVTTNSLAVPVLDPGTYTLVIQQTSSNLTSYSLDFAVVPAPGAAASLALGLLAARRRR